MARFLTIDLMPELLSYNSNHTPPISFELLKQQQTPPLMLFYIGDPAIKLAIPKSKIRLTKVNDIPITQPSI
jgi:hypothetical protein